MYAFTCLLFFFSILNVGAQVKTFWQISDIHLELNYSRTGDIKDDCRGNVISNEDLLGVFGDFWCDSPFALFQDAVKHMKNTKPNPDFILWTGDNFPHLKLKDVSWDMILAAIKNSTAIIRNAFPNTLIVPVLGNHDVRPWVNFPWDTFADYSEKFLTEGGWLDLIPSNQVNNWKKGGYYSVFVNDQLTILVVNTFIYEDQSDQGDDPKGQFAWLKEQLQTAEKNNSNVIVTSHIPPGLGNMESQLLVSPYLEEYVKIMTDFGHVILTQIYGHLHIDTFNLFYDNTGILRSHAFAAPSITPWKYPRTTPIGNSPAVRLYEYSLYTRTILDYHQYSMNLTVGNEMADEGKAPPGPWQLLYKATELYKVPNLNLSSMGHIYNSITIDRKVFDDYLLMYFVGARRKECDENCRNVMQCVIIALTPEQIKNCD